MSSTPEAFLILTFLLGTYSAFAQAPVPRALKDAKTVYLINDGAERDLFDNLASELLTLGRS